jgi:hypothetical protein
MRERRRLLAGLVLLVVSACAPPQPPAPVQGKVVYRDTVGQIPGLKLWPKDRPGARPIEVPCNRQGEFSTSVPPGQYKVCVLMPLGPDGEPDETFPTHYTEPETTPLAVLDVPPGGVASHLIQITE